MPVSASLPQLNRFFVHPQYSIYHRRVKRLHWTNGARSDFGVLFLLEGRLEYEIEDQSGEIKREQLLLLEPCVGASAKGQSAEFLLLTVSSSFVMDYAVRMRLIGPGTTVAFQPRLVERDEQLLQLAESLAAELAEENAGREIIVAALIEQIVVRLLRHYSNMRRSDELELSRVGLIDRRIRRAVELMHARLDEDLSLREIAAASYLSPFHFSRLFKKLTGATPHSYLAGLRTARAQLLLAETDLSVTQISSRVGYSSPSHFSKAFRQATGLTPRAFRAALVLR
jgi:AraC family transcriptional regulator